MSQSAGGGGGGGEFTPTTAAEFGDLEDWENDAAIAIAENIPTIDEETFSRHVEYLCNVLSTRILAESNCNWKVPDELNCFKGTKKAVSIGRYAVKFNMTWAG